MKDKDKDNITNLSDIRKQLETAGEKEQDKRDFFSDADISKIFSELDLPHENSILMNLINSKDIDEMLESLQNGNYSYEEISELIGAAKKFEEQFKKEKKTYRTFGQWISFNKPYNLSNLYPIENIRALAGAAGIQFDRLDSKNSIIEKTVPSLEDYYRNVFLSLDATLMSIFGEIIYADGKLPVNTVFTEEKDESIDYLIKKCVLARVKEFGNHYLVIPTELQAVIHKLDFGFIDKYNQLNTVISKTVKAFVNSYGAFPKKILYNRILKFDLEILNQFAEQELDQYIDKYLEDNLINKKLSAPIVVSGEYISHSIIEFTKYLTDIQNETIHEYKELTMEDIFERGQSLYYDNSIYLKQVSDILLQCNSLDSDEEASMKNLIYLFSRLEFEPSLILQALQVRYMLPDDKQYGTLVEILRSYYKNSEKWILKGYTSFEVNSEIDGYHAGKIVKVDFGKQ